MADESLWGRIKSFANSGWGKGILITAAAMIVAVALLGGWMGTEPGAFSVNNLPVTTFESGFSHGISRAFEFLIRPMGLAVMGIGGAVGAYIQHKKEHAVEPNGPSFIEKIRDNLGSHSAEKEQEKEVRKNTDKEVANDDQHTRDEMRELNQENKELARDLQNLKDEQKDKEAAARAIDKDNAESLEMLKKQVDENAKLKDAQQDTPAPVDQVVTVNNVQIDQHQHHEHNYDLKQLNTMVLEANDKSVKNNSLAVAVANKEAAQPKALEASAAPVIDKSIYVPDSATKEASFAAAELKRRSDKELAGSNKSI